MSRIIIIGPGRAGLSVALAARRAGHQLVAVAARHPFYIAELDIRSQPIFDPLPAADLTILAVSDDAIEAVASQVVAPTSSTVIHLSGRTSVNVLARFEPRAGSMHPLMTMPSPEVGSASLRGSGAAITSHSKPVVEELSAFAVSLGMEPFELSDAAKPAYHAAASAASNFVVAALAVAEALFHSAGLPLSVAGPLIRASVANASDLGALGALTGPIARGDVDTVLAQRDAASRSGLEEPFVDFGRATARLAGTWDVMEAALS